MSSPLQYATFTDPQVQSENSTLEKVFQISFRTVPKDSRGAPHVLEHVLVRGSRQFPSFDTFSRMAKTSLATVQNAVTYPDRTGYFASTISTQDLYNFARVYLDGVFDPLFLHDKSLFEQEGWRYELDSAEAPLRYNGVVLNEMKGKVLRQGYVLLRAEVENLLNGTVYQPNSGGVPEEIVKLSQRDLVDFYHEHYHPSNADIVYFGNPDEMPRLLRLIDRHLTSAANREATRDPTRARFTAEKRREAIHLQLQPGRWNFGIYRDIEGPVVVDRGLDLISTAVYLGDVSVLSHCDRLSLELLGKLLVDSVSSPLVGYLNAKAIGQGTVTDGFVRHKSALLFAMGRKVRKQDRFFRGSDESEEEADGAMSDGPDGPVEDYSVHRGLERAMRNGLEEIMEMGFDVDEVNATLYQFELESRRKVSDGAARGLKLVDEVLDLWNFGRDPLETFGVKEVFQCIKDRATSEPKYFESLIQKYFLDNERWATFRLHSDANLEERHQWAEEQALADTKRSLTPSQISDLVDETARVRDLRCREDSPEVLASLPRLSWGDISQVAQVYPAKISDYQNIPVALHALPTAGIAHLEIVTDLRDFTWEQLTLLRLVNRLLPVTPSLTRSARELRLQRGTGGIEMGMSLSHRSENGRILDPTTLVGFQWRSVSCLTDSLERCLQLFYETTFDFWSLPLIKGTVSGLIEGEIRRVQLQLRRDPETVAADLLASQLHLLPFVRAHLEGYWSLKWLWALQQRMKTDWEGVLGDIRAVVVQLHMLNRMALSITGDEDTLKLARKAAERHILDEVIGNYPLITTGNRMRSFDVDRGLIYERPAFVEHFANWSRPTKSVGVFVDLPGRVYFNRLGGILQPFGVRQQTAQGIVAQILSKDYVFPNLRLLGAYGGSFGSNSAMSIYVFSSHNDPNVEKTYDLMMRGAGAALKKARTISQTEIDLGIIQAVGAMNRIEPYQTQGRTIFAEWINGIDQHRRDKIRSQLLNVTVQDFIDFANTLSVSMKKGPFVAVTFGPSAGRKAVKVPGLSEPLRVLRVDQLIGELSLETKPQPTNAHTALRHSTKTSSRSRNATKGQSAKTHSNKAEAKKSESKKAKSKKVSSTQVHSKKRRKRKSH